MHPAWRSWYPQDFEKIPWALRHHRTACLDTLARLDSLASTWNPNVSRTVAEEHLSVPSVALKSHAVPACLDRDNDASLPGGFVSASLSAS